MAERDPWKDLERELRSARPEPPDTLVATITAWLRAARPRHRPLFRLAVAAALTGGVLAVFTGLGAVDEAAGAAAKVAQVARALAGPPPGQGNQGDQDNQGQDNQGQDNQSQDNQSQDNQSQDNQSQDNQGNPDLVLTVESGFACTGDVVAGEKVEGGLGQTITVSSGAEIVKITIKSGANASVVSSSFAADVKSGTVTLSQDVSNYIVWTCTAADGEDGDEVADDQYAQTVAICHRTRSATNPYVLIVISVNAVPAHQQHTDPPDIIPAPSTGCPTTVP